MAYNPRARPTQGPPNTYTPHEMMRLIATANTALDQHLFAATEYVTELLTQNRVSYTIMGGFSLRLRGSDRATHDVDIAVGCDMNRLLQLIRPQTR